MSQNVSEDQKKENEQGFPLQLKLLLAVMVVAVGAIVVKMLGIL